MGGLAPIYVVVISPANGGQQIGEYLLIGNLNMVQRVSLSGVDSSSLGETGVSQQSRFDVHSFRNAIIVFKPFSILPTHPQLQLALQVSFLSLSFSLLSKPEPWDLWFFQHKHITVLILNIFPVRMCVLLSNIHTYLLFFGSWHGVGK